MLLRARERILTIRLLDKLSAHPAYAASLGIEYAQETVSPDDSQEPP